MEKVIRYYFAFRKQGQRPATAWDNAMWEANAEIYYY